MNTLESKDDLVFDYRTLRLIIGALAFAFPCVVIALTGKITTSISASYHEAATRDVFVGFLFIIGTLLISYKGHLQGQARKESEPLWEWILSFQWVKRYQEDLVSTLGGAAAIFTALNPTACDGCSIDTRAVIHLSGAFILFSTVVYFSLFAFLRSLNEKLVEDNPDFLEIVLTVRRVQSLRDVHSFRELGYRLFPTVSIFLGIATRVHRDYEQNDAVQIDRALPDVPARPNKVGYLWMAYGKKITRGYVYLVCGSLIAATLVVFLLLLLTAPGLAKGSVLTFIVETIALALFGIAWMTASKLAYLSRIQDWLRSRSKKTVEVTQPGAA